MQMNANKNAALVLILALIGLAPRAAQAGNTLSFTDSYSDALVNDVADGLANVVTSGSGTINITLPLSGVDISTFDGSTMFNLNMGPNVNINQALSDDPAYKPGNKSATFKDTNDLGKVIGTLKVSWTATAITVTGTAANQDFYGAKETYGTPGVAGTTTISDVIDVSLSLGDFNYDNPNVIVTGNNTDKEVVDKFDMPQSLESGSIKGAADFTRPVVTISAPAANLKTSNGVVKIVGKATDNAGLASVWCMEYGDTESAIQIATFDPTLNLKSGGFTNILDLSQTDFGWVGTNALEFFALDTSSNMSSVVTRTVLWFVATNLTLQTNGPGGITGLKNNQAVNIGQGYPVTAKASPGYILEAWTDGSGNYLSGNASFNYVVGDYDGGATLTANFVPNPYPPLKGTYTGLFFDDINGATPTNAGYITLTLTTNGFFTGRLYLGTANYAMSDQFEFPYDFAQGDTSTNVAYVMVKPSAHLWLDVVLSLNLDTNLADPGAGFISGTIYAYDPGSSPDSDYNQFWQVPVTMELSRYVASNGVPGLYNLEIPPVGDDPTMAPGGYGYGSATLSSKGAVALVLNLADGTTPTTSFSTFVAGDGTFPFFASLYSGKGVILGWLTFTNDTSAPADLEGNNLAWVKLPVANKFYTNGFSTVSGPFVTGSIYVPPKTGTNILATATNLAGSTQLPVAFNAGNGGVNMSATATYNAQKNTFTSGVETGQKLTLTLPTPTTGLISGSFVPSAGAKPVTFKGVVLPGAGAAYGFFNATNQDTGSFLLGTPNMPTPGGITPPVVSESP
jgi:hypothetical protein